MKKQKLLKEFTKKDFLDFFAKVDRDLNKKLSITILGGASIVLLDFKDRATQDIDVAPPIDSLFLKAGNKNGIPIQSAGNLVSTVDFEHCEKPIVFKGKFLTVHSISPEELIKSKLERFQKQDPEDIYSIIQKTNYSYESFKDLVKEMRIDFVGAPIKLLMHARTVVEQIYPEKSEEFYKEVN